jgi:hypothetical protein
MQIPRRKTSLQKEARAGRESSLSENLRKSLQSCKVSENEEKLEGLLVDFKKNHRILQGLLYILRQLLAFYNGCKSFGYLPYDDFFWDFLWLHI